MANQYKNVPKIFVHLSFWLILSIVLAGCGGAASEPPTATSIPSATIPPATDTTVPTDTPAPTETPLPTETLVPTEIPPLPTEPAAPTATKKKQYTVIIGQETSLGSENDKSKVAVYITGGRIMVYTKGFKANVTLSVRISSKGQWNELQKVRVPKNSEQTASVDLPSSLYSVTPITICLKSMKSSEQNCYSVPNPAAP